MTRKTKQELIAQIVAMINAVIEVENEQQITEQKSSAPVEMLTVKECTEAVKGLSEHTVRQLVARKRYRSSERVRASVVKFSSARLGCWNTWEV